MAVGDFVVGGNLGQTLLMAEQIRNAREQREAQRAQMQQQQALADQELARRANTEAYQSRALAGDPNAMAEFRGSYPVEAQAFQQSQLESRKAEFDLRKANYELNKAMAGGGDSVTEAMKKAQFESDYLSRNASILANNPSYWDQFAQRHAELRRSGLISFDLPQTDVPPNPEQMAQLSEQMRLRADNLADPQIEGKARQAAQMIASRDKITIGQALRSPDFYPMLDELTKRGGININAEKPLPVTAVTEIADAGSALKAVDQIFDAFNESIGSDNAAEQAAAFAASKVPNTKENIYIKSTHPGVQLIGGFLEGGKLTDSDFWRYAGMLPQPGDSREAAERKRESMKRLISDRMEGRRAALRSANYKTPEAPTEPAKTLDLETELNAMRSDPRWSKMTDEQRRMAEDELRKRIGGR